MTVLALTASACDSSFRDSSKSMDADASSGSVWVLDSDVVLVNWEGNSAEVSITAGRNPIIDLAWSPDGRDLAIELPTDDAFGIAIVHLRTGDVEEFGGTATSGATQPAWSPDGRFLAFTMIDVDLRPLGLAVTPAGRYRPRLLVEGMATSPVWSPDGGTIAYAGAGGIWIAEVVSGMARRITSGTDGSPAWSPDGAQLLFDRISGSRSDIYIVDIETATPDLLVSDASYPAWSPDGRRITFLRAIPDSPFLSARVARFPGGGERALWPSPVQAATPVWSPDGARVALVVPRTTE